MLYSIAMNKQQSGNQRRSMDARVKWTLEADRIREMYRTESCQKIADHYGVSLSGMQKVMARLGIKPRPRWRSGKDNGRYKHGLASQLYRKMVAKKSCAVCGTTENLCVHHVNGDHSDNRISNLEVQCMSCHSRLHKQAWWGNRRGR